MSRSDTCELGELLDQCLSCQVRVANIGRSSIELGFRKSSEVYQQRSLAALSRIDDKSLELHFVEKRHRFARMPAANKDGSFVAK